MGLQLVRNGLMWLLWGWVAAPAMLIALFLQALLFHFGGLTVLGIQEFPGIPRRTSMASRI